ncbi:thiolester hydrolase activity [Nesidiocoris tenuis]|uniref:Thiolester hydrolase activity n=1 Tax=Nesidiocoris tenuis TaxID=355587 RepID=A0ABN7BFJ5_9HEMI|nr:thiolester hydrolase activity [Nesidiocoris tenuis]
MAPREFKILQKCESRLQDVVESVGTCTAGLYGLKYENSVLVIGLSIANDANFTIELSNPYNVELVGVADIGGKISESELCEKLKSVTITDEPVVLNVSSAGSVESRSLLNGKLVSSSFDVLDDDEFLSAFLFVNFVVPADETETGQLVGGNADLAEEATEMSSCPDSIEGKLQSEPPAFKISGSEIESKNIVPGELYDEHREAWERDPRHPENLAILTVELEFPYDVTFLKRNGGQGPSLDVINTLCLVSRDEPANLLELFIKSAERSIEYLKKEIVNEEVLFYTTQIFFPLEIGYAISVIFPKNVLEDVLFKKRLILHESLGLTTAAPKFTPSMALSHVFGRSPAVSYSGEKHLVNVHADVKPPKLRDVQINLVRGFYNYFHYLQDGENDDGWGCAYRSLQTIFSWFSWQGYTSLQVPSIREIQEILVKIKDKPESFIGSKQWIGSQELCYVLDEKANVMCRIVHVPSGKGMLEERFTLASHFEEQGTPVMVGGGQYAYTILGIACGDSPNDTRFLILDPHYVGPHDVKTILRKNGVSWKSVDMFKSGQFYNLCLPLAASTF